MTSPELRYEKDHVATLIPENLSPELRSRYLKYWGQWLTWCQGNNLHPGTATRADMAQFVAQLPPVSQKYIQQDIGTVYRKLGGANPARRLQTLTPDGRLKYQQRWSKWTTWCELASIAPLPADPDQLATYLDEVEKKISPRVAARSMQTISRAHIEASLPDPQRTSPVIIQKVADITAAVTTADKTAKPRRASSVQSPNTVRRDQGIWRHWSKWCAGREIDPMSAEDEDVVAFLKEKRHTCIYDYIRNLYTSLRTSYRRNGTGQNPADSNLVRDTLRALKNDHISPIERGDPAVPSDDDYGYPEDDMQHLAVRTRSCYRSYWRNWSIWCIRQGIEPLNADPQQLAVFLTEEADRLAMKSVELYVAAIGCVYEISASDRENSARDLLVKRTVKGLKLLHRDSPPSQMTGLTAEGLARIEATARRPQPWETERQALVRGTTDLAIVGLMRDAMLRVSEAAAITWDDLDEEEHGSGRLTITHSKTDQEGEGAVQFISPQTMEWLKQMRELVMDGPTIFGINQKSIYFRIVDATRYAGLEGHYGGHSPRIGMAQDLARANTSMPLLMQAGRWKTPEAPIKYIRKLAAGHNAVAQWYVRHPGRSLIG